MDNVTTTVLTPQDHPCPENREGLLAYACFYFNIHGFICLAICCFGIPTNIINIIILTNKKLRSPINTVLTGIAVSDVLTMTCYMPYAIHFNIMHGPERTPEKYTYEWTWFLAVHAGLSITTHTISVWLGVVMAIMRYIFIKSMGRRTKTINTFVATMIVIAVYCLTVVSYIPNYVFTEVLSLKVEESNTSTYRYEIRNMKLGGADETTLEQIAAWIFVTVGKILPCALIILFGILLLFSLHESQKRTLSLKGAHVDMRLKQHKRTTMMLLAIILMYIISELPSSVLVLVGLCDNSFFDQVYPLLADTLDVISLINSSINFILYCGMSRQFRVCLCEFACDAYAMRSNKLYHTVRSQTHSTVTHRNNIHIRVV